MKRKMIEDITSEHYAQILRINEQFVHWLSPMDEDELIYVLSIADYKRQIGSAQGVLIGYPHDADYPDHKNLIWLRRHVQDFFYIERIIIDESSQGKGYGRRLYQDIESYAQTRGYKALACEVNTRPDNPGSHKFHEAFGFESIGEENYPSYNKAVRYYKKTI